MSSQSYTTPTDVPLLLKRVDGKVTLEGDTVKPIYDGPEGDAVKVFTTVKAHYEARKAAAKDRKPEDKDTDRDPERKVFFKRNDIKDALAK